MRPVLAVLLGSLIATRLAMAQGSLVALRTGDGVPLQTEARSMMVNASLREPRLQFSFGFATEENVVPDRILDSFTVMLQDSNRLFTLVCLTADASGVLLAPPTPGGLPLDPATISAQAIPYPSLQPVLPSRSAFQISLPFPASRAKRIASVNVFQRSAHESAALISC